MLQSSPRPSPKAELAAVNRGGMLLALPSGGSSRQGLGGCCTGTIAPVRRRRPTLTHQNSGSVGFDLIPNPAPALVALKNVLLDDARKRRLYDGADLCGAAAYAVRVAEGDEALMRAVEAAEYAANLLGIRALESERSWKERDKGRYSLKELVEERRDLSGSLRLSVATDAVALLEAADALRRNLGHRDAANQLRERVAAVLLALSDHAVELAERPLKDRLRDV